MYTQTSMLQVIMIYIHRLTDNKNDLDLAGYSFNNLLVVFDDLPDY